MYTAGIVRYQGGKAQSKFPFKNIVGLAAAFMPHE
jgi:hypothetical protein